jgi:hypothetical protein
MHAHHHMELQEEGKGGDPRGYSSQYYILLGLVLPKFDQCLVICTFFNFPVVILTSKYLG